MSDLKEINYNLDSLTKEHKLKKLRNKNSYMDAFLERRKQAADFATEKRNPSSYNYTKPNYYINDGKIVKKSLKNNKQNKNSIEDKQEFYNTYNTLKKNLTGKNNSINNIILIEKENNKYYLSQGIPKTYECKYNYSHYKTLNHHHHYHCCGCCKNKNKHKKDIYCKHNYSGKETYYKNEFADELLTNDEINKKYNNIKHHSINNISKKNHNGQKTKQKNKSKNNKNNNDKENEVEINTFGNNLKIEKTGINTYYKNIVASSPTIKINNNKDIFISNKSENNINNHKYKSVSVQNTNNNLINSIKLKERNNNNNIIIKDNSANNIYYEGTDNHNFYDSNKMSKYKYNYEPYKTNIIQKNGTQKQKNYYSRNLSEPQNLERNKNLYILKSKKNTIEFDMKKNPMNDISPIRSYIRYDYEDNNDEIRNIEKIYESQSINGNSFNNSHNKLAYNTKLQQNNFNNIKKNINLIDNNDINVIKSVELNRPSSEVIINTPNTKTISIVYKSEKNKTNNNKNYPITNIHVIQEPNKINLNKREIVEIKNVNKDKDINPINNFDNLKKINLNYINHDINNINNINDINDINKDLYKYRQRNYIFDNNDVNDEKESKFRKEIKNIEMKYINNIKNIKENNDEKLKYRNNEKINLPYTFSDKKNENKNENNIKDNNIKENNIKDKNIKENNIKENNIKENKINIINKEEDNKSKNKNNEIIDLNLEDNKEINKDKDDDEEDDKNKDNNDDYPKLVDQEQNYELIKEKYESFLRQKDEKEPNLQSRIMNSMLTSKDESNLINNKNSLIKNIKEKIQILKNNNKSNKNNLNYSFEIDDYFNKIKKKEEKNNLVLNELLKKERERENANEYKTKNTDNNINTNTYNNILNNNTIKENDNKKENKKIIIKKSNRLQNMMKNILNNQKYKNYNLNNYNTMTIRNTYSKNYLNNNKPNNTNELNIKNNFNNLKFSKYKNAPDINLIVNENIEENIKIMDEDEYSKLKRKNIKSSRPINLMNKKVRDNNYRISSYREKFDLFGCYDKGYKMNNKYMFNCDLNGKYKSFFSPKIILEDLNHKIMPANEII